MSSLRAHLGRGAAAVADQGLFAGANFLLNICLARWLMPDAYGAFTVAFTVFLYIGLVHSSLVSDPMLVFGPGRYARRESRYLGTVLVGHIALSIVAAALLLVAGVFATGAMSGELFVLACAQPFILLLWLSRQMCYMRSIPQAAASAGLAYLVLLIVALGALVWMDWLSGATALGAMGVVSAIAAFGLMHAADLRCRMMSLRRSRAILRRQWRYGRWALATAMNRSVPGYLPLLVLPLVLDLAASGALKALLNLALPFVMASAAITSMLTPAFVRARGTTAFSRTARNALILLTAAPLLCWLPLGWFHEPIMRLLYGGNFMEHSHLLWLVGLIPVLTSASSVLGSQLRAIERPDLLFYGSIAASVAAVTIGVPAMFAYGIAGMLWALLAAYGAQAMALWLLGHRLFAVEGKEQDVEDRDEQTNPDMATAAAPQPRVAPRPRRAGRLMEGAAAAAR